MPPWTSPFPWQVAILRQNSDNLFIRFYGTPEKEDWIDTLGGRNSGLIKPVTGQAAMNRFFGSGHHETSVAACGFGFWKARFLEKGRPVALLLMSDRAMT